MINNSMPTQATIEQIKVESNRFKDLPTEIGKVIVGQHHIVDLIVNAILCNLIQKHMILKQKKDQFLQI